MSSRGSFFSVKVRARSSKAKFDETLFFIYKCHNSIKVITWRLIIFTFTSNKNNAKILRNDNCTTILPRLAVVQKYAKSDVTQARTVYYNAKIRSK